MRIRVVRSGGFAGLRVERAVDTTLLPIAERVRVERLVIEADFFELPARAVSGLPDVIQYQVWVEADRRHHEVATDERTAGGAMLALVERVLGVEP